MSLTVTNSVDTATMTRTDYISVAVVVPDSATYFPLPPLRVLDTRANLGLSGAFRANIARDFQVADGTTIPIDAVAVTGNLTVTQQTKAGYLVLAPAAGSATSTVNFPVGDNRANGVTVSLSGSGSLNAVFKSKAGATTHILFDVTGYFKNVTGGARFHPVSPVRVLDTRVDPGPWRRFRANVARDSRSPTDPPGRSRMRRSRSPATSPSPGRPRPATSSWHRLPAGRPRRSTSRSATTGPTA